MEASAESRAGERAPIAYWLLGPLAAARPDAVALDLGAPKQRAVLALLALHVGRNVSTGRLVEALWEDDPPPSAVGSLQVYVSNLRRTLRDAAGSSSPIVRRTTGYALEAPSEALDVTPFTAEARGAREAADAGRWAEALELAERALGRWRGAALEDLRDQAWVALEVADLEELRAEAQEVRVTALLAEGRVAQALAAARELRAQQPLRDRACWLLVVALHRSGRDSDALEEHRAYAARLDEELGLEPGPELRELQVAVLRHDPALAAWPRPPGWTGATQLQTPEVAEPLDGGGEGDAGRGAAEVDPLLGRDREVAVLDGALADAESGATRWLTLTGPAGIGKTRLAEELTRRAQARGGRVAWARCSEEDGAPAWWPVRQLVRGLGEQPDAVLASPADADADAGRFAIYERVAGVVAVAAEGPGPLVLVVDDVQWADAGSARALAHLAGALRGAGAVVALTLRPEEVAGAVAPLLTALARHDGHRQLAVAPLEPAPAAALAGLVAAEPLADADASALVARTGGNPLFVREYARLPAGERAAGDTPLAVRAVLGRRLAALGDEVVGVLRAAAVIGDAIDVPVLAAATRLDVDDLADLLDLAADEHVLEPRGRSAGYAFAHGLLREEALAGMPAGRRARVHLRVAGALEGSRDVDAVPRRATHLLAAGELVDAEALVAACRAAARVAEERWSSEDAAGWWAVALAAYDRLPTPDRDAGAREELVLAQVAALARAGRRDTLLEVLDAALLEAVRVERPAGVGRLAASLLRSAGSWPWPSIGADPLPMVERLAGLEAFVAAEPAAHARLLAALSVGRAYDPDPAVPDDLSRRAVELAEEAGDPDVLADALLGRLSAYAGVATHAGEAVALAARLAALPHAGGRVDEVIGLGVTVMARCNLGDVPGAARDGREAIAGADALRLPVVRAQLRWMEAMLAIWHGDLEGAAALGALAMRSHEQTQLYSEGTNPIFELSLARERGTLADARIDGFVLEADAWAAAVAAARGDADEVARAAGRWLDALAALPRWVWTTLPHLALVGEALADAGLPERAREVLELLGRCPDAVAVIGHSGPIGTVGLVRGRLLALLGEGDEARAVLRAALVAAERTGGAPTAARCRRALAAL